MNKDRIGFSFAKKGSYREEDFLGSLLKSASPIYPIYRKVSDDIDKILRKYGEFLVKNL